MLAREQAHRLTGTRVVQHRLHVLAGGHHPFGVRVAVVTGSVTVTVGVLGRIPRERVVAVRDAVAVHVGQHQRSRVRVTSHQLV